jgi:transposase-like protein
MGESRRKFDQDFREGAVRLVRETGRPIAQIARDLGIIFSSLVDHGVDLHGCVSDSVAVVAARPC